jgi:transposase
VETDATRDAAYEGGVEAQVNKTDRNDARGIAQMMRAGLYRQVHVKTLRSQKLRMLLTNHRWHHHHWHHGYGPTASY